jgi:hypothetical protein
VVAGGDAGNGNGGLPAPARRSYCSVAGNTNPVTGAALRRGTFLNLEAGQPAVDPHYEGAVPANFLEGIGTSCGLPHGFRATGLTVGQGGLGTPGFYRFYAKHEPPEAPAGLSGHFLAGSLLLSWQAASGKLPVVGYELAINGKPFMTVPGMTEALVRTFVPGGSSMFTVRALDAAGFTSAHSNAVHVRPSPRPAHAPRRIPQWAWQLLAWQQRGSTGRRPAAAPTGLPAWYAHWKAWRQAPFALAD